MSRCVIRAEKTGVGGVRGSDLPEEGPPRPHPGGPEAKPLADSLVALMEGNAEFEMIDAQKVVLDGAVHLVRSAAPDEMPGSSWKGDP